MNDTQLVLMIRRPDDFHLHVRDDAVLGNVVRYSASHFGRALIMPNLKPPVTTVAQALAYHDRIRNSLPEGTDFEPLMSLYLTDDTDPDEIAKAKDSGTVIAVKYYPAGATTNSAAGVTDIAKTYKVLERMQELGIPLLLHGEVSSGDPFDRESIFIDRVLRGLVDDFPVLRIVLEHITTSDAVSFVESQGSNIVATITPQHMLLNREDLLSGGIKPHMYCMPILKREENRIAVLNAATSGNPKFFLGTDSAPHGTDTKHAACGCAGCFTAPIAILLYAQAFESVGKLNRLECFSSRFGAEFYGLPLNQGIITLERNHEARSIVPQSYEFGPGTTVTPLYAGAQLEWKYD